MYDKFKYESYEQYIAMQCKHNTTLFRTVNRSMCRMDDIITIKRVFPAAKSVLCVGARDKSEVIDFKNAGFHAEGIDVYSTSQEITIVDMHDMSSKFLHHNFDVAYMSHSLEHSYDPIKVLNEVKNVCALGCMIIVPVMIAPTMKDPVVFNFMKTITPNLEDVQQEIRSILSDDQLRICSLTSRRPAIPDATDEIVLTVTF